MLLYLLLPQLVFANSSVLQHPDSPLDILTYVSNMSVDWVGYGYAALIASGGVVGYVKAGSVPSLAAGALFGGLAGLGAYQISNDPNNIWVSLATSGALTGIMGKRFYASRKLMPAGLMAGASLLMVGKLSLALLQKPQST
ncbi:transmembrane protein 14C isoform X1 [Epinephelus fuscoguttatus]|uniref:transmembrane protein 14C isoform X1 n=1 Tax=Epinephelus fuscoguttatus TaxID=293821 RepID=UPI0020D0F801|nr:transmembrane protein 14C isoform X1 [Epinephelus fuscoguttatus]